MDQLTPEDRDILLAARTLLSDPNRWTQGAAARNRDGYPVKPRHESACCWCIQGALAHFSPGGLIPYPVLRWLDAAAPLFRPSYVDWQVHKLNDDVFDHEALMGFMDFLVLGQSEA